MKVKRPEEINNWLLKDSVDCVKDETSLDIDLSACAPIPSAPTDNTLSDVWSTSAEWAEKESALAVLVEDCDSNACAPGMLPLEQVKSENVNVTKETTITEKRDATLLQLLRTARNEVRLLQNVKKEEPVTPATCPPKPPAKTSVKGPPFKCRNCEEEFDTKEALKTHGSVHRSNRRRNEVYTCPVCDKQLKVSSMWLHRKIHNDSERFSCDICGQKFVQKINLIHHTKAHLGEKPFECPQCQMSFPERSHLIKHQRYHTSTRQYKCEKCGKMYKTERCLKVHNLVHLDKRPFVCSECNKSFISSSKLKQHSNIHTGERPYKCKYCSRDFTNFPNWLKHTRRRHKVDHKTGEVLQNLPSYATKKSATTKDKKKASVEVETVKKAVAAEAAAAETMKIKTETEFMDIHGMSLNSAEELIMEQALEMEESGYLMSPPSDATLGSPPILSQYEYMPLQLNDLKPDLPLSSTASNFPFYAPSLTPFHTTMHDFSSLASGNDTTTPQQPHSYPKTLPSVETLFASSFHKASLQHH